MAWRFLGEPVETPYFTYLGKAEHTVRKLEAECPEDSLRAGKESPSAPNPLGVNQPCGQCKTLVS